VRRRAGKEGEDEGGYNKRKFNNPFLRQHQQKNRSKKKNKSKASGHAIAHEKKSLKNDTGKMGSNYLWGKVSWW